MTVESADTGELAGGDICVSLIRQCAAEAIGTFLLLATIVGSGIMAERLSGDLTALALLANSVAVGSILVVLILCLGPVSGAHFNPAVTFVFWLRREISAPTAAAFVAVQVLAAIVGTMAAHFMFEMDLVTWGTHARSGPSQWLAEGIATFALVFTILACVKFRPDCVAFAVGLVIVAGFWYTSSTSFANPAVTIARGFTDSFASIAPADVVPFIVAQLAAAALALGTGCWLFKDAAQ